MLHDTQWRSFCIVKRANASIPNPSSQNTGPLRHCLTLKSTAIIIVRGRNIPGNLCALIYGCSLFRLIIRFFFNWVDENLHRSDPPLWDFLPFALCRCILQLNRLNNWGICYVCRIYTSMRKKGITKNINVKL